jgi:glycosyltransferase involved in cell wall biosynthesis
MSSPLVSIVTPVYNGEKYLAECIESVLRQTYEHWEYLIVNNCSNDSTLEVARKYAARDSRIQVHDCSDFVDVIASHNRAVRLISHESKYCKIVSADDWLFPDCVTRMVELAEGRASVGVVNAYVLRGGGAYPRVKFDGLPYERTIISGRDICRWHLLGHPYCFGVPSSVLYRSDLVWKTPSFFPNVGQHADVSLFFQCLRDNDFGFIHQVLAFERVHADRITTEAEMLSTYAGSRLLDVKRYGPWYLTEDELRTRLRQLLREYYALLAVGAVNLQGRRFWKYHRAIVRELGSTSFSLRLAGAVGMKVADLLLNPKMTMERILRRVHGRIESEGAV